MNAYSEKMRLSTALSHHCFTYAKVHDSYTSQVENQRTSRERQQPFDPKRLSASAEAIFATDVLLQACRRKEATMSKNILARKYLVPVHESQIRKFDKFWRFTCSDKMACINGSQNMFTKMTHRSWDEMVSPHCALAQDDQLICLRSPPRSSLTYTPISIEVECYAKHHSKAPALGSNAVKSSLLRKTLAIRTTIQTRMLSQKSKIAHRNYRSSSPRHSALSRMCLRLEVNQSS